MNVYSINRVHINSINRSRVHITLEWASIKSGTWSVQLSGTSRNIPEHPKKYKMAQLVEHGTSIVEVMDSNPVRALIFSGFNFTTA